MSLHSHLKSGLSSYFIQKEGPLRDFYFERLRPAYLRFAAKREQKQWEGMGKQLLSEAAVREAIRTNLLHKKPYTLAKIGGNELSLLQWFLGASIAEIKFSQIFQVAGVFPYDKTFFREFAGVFAESLKSLSLLGLWMGKGEPEIYRKLGLSSELTNHATFSGSFEEIAMGKSTGWFPELKGYRVLVVSSFAEQIEARVNESDWNRYWAGRIPWIAPSELKAVPFPYGFEAETQVRYGNSLKLLEAFKREHQTALEHCDILLAGCGAYVVPLLDWAYQHGKVGIHMGGNIQLLFGIKGGRWDNREGPLGQLYNEHWVRPAPHLVPSSAQQIERSAYW